MGATRSGSDPVRRDSSLDRDTGLDRDRDTGRNDGNSHGRRLATETKAAFKTTEFIAFLAVLAGLLIAAALIDGGRGHDSFVAPQVWQLVTYLTIGYMVARGLAKAGSKQPYDER